MSILKSWLSAAAVMLATLSTSPAEPPTKGTLDISIYNPGAKGTFAVSSAIISGSSEVVLIDAQMGRADAEVLVARIKATHKALKAVYVSQSDPDFYFGLETIRAAFPDVRIFATPQTIAAINATKVGKLAYWGPLLKENAPKLVIVPEALKGDTLTVDGEPLQIVGLDGPTPDRTFLWIPSAKAVLGGTVVVANEHVFMADSQSRQSRDDWRKTLARIESLQPAIVVPGHYHLNPDGNEPRSLASVRFTRDYLTAFETETVSSSHSAELMTRMKAHYPALTADIELKRLGLPQKPMFVVPNHMLKQFSSELLTLYPTANILVAGKEDFEASKRARLFSRIATGNWDGVIVTHASFEKIPMSFDARTRFIEGQIREVELAIRQDRGAQRGTRLTAPTEGTQMVFCEARLLRLDRVRFHAVATPA